MKRLDTFCAYLVAYIFVGPAILASRFTFHGEEN